MADDGTVRPESERGRGFRWPEAAVWVRGAVGKGVAFERGGAERSGDGGADGAVRAGRERFGSGPRPAGACDMRHMVIAGRAEEGRRGLTGGPRHSVGRRCR
jgi:hypothetical protein